MKFDVKRFSQLAGIPDAPAVEPKRATRAEQRQSPGPVSELRRIDEARPERSDEARLREIIRSEARRMVRERFAHGSETLVEALQEKKSLIEAIAMGFAGPGFGGPIGVLGGPLTSARRLFSKSQVEEGMFPSWNPSEMSVGATMDDVGRDVLELDAEEELGLSREEIDRMDDDQLRQALAEPLARR